MIIEELKYEGYERVVHATDAETELDAYVAIHSTHLGPALGGLRIFSYPRRYEGTAPALVDVLRLAKGMTYKNSLAGLDLGGGKAVINGTKTAAKLMQFAEVLEYLDGSYITAEDVGTSVDDMRIIRKTTNHVVNPEIGDPSPATALGVLRAMEACVRRLTGSRSLSDTTIAIQGLGNVGYPLAEMLHYKGAKIIATDINKDNCDMAEQRLGATIVGLDEIYDVSGTIFAPCAMGAVINENTVDRLNVEIVCGSANNQLATVEDGEKLHKREIIYGPDYLANAGGVMNVAREFGWVNTDFHIANMLDNIYIRMSKVVLEAELTRTPTYEIADKLALERLED
jgi:leucine dehydrogenase